MDRQLLRQTLTVAADAGLLGAEEDLVDRFMGAGAGAAARQGTLTLIRRAVAAVLRQGATERTESLQQAVQLPGAALDPERAGSW